MATQPAQDSTFDLFSAARQAAEKAQQGLAKGGKRFSFRFKVSYDTMHDIAAYETATPGLVVHRSPLVPRLWVVAHLKSGMSIINARFNTKKEAVSFALYLSDYGDWKQEGSALQRQHTTESMKECFDGWKAAEQINLIRSAFRSIGES